MRNALILGSGRSGTSLVAGLMANAGWFVGDDPYPARAANAKGFFEARDVNGINERLIAGVEPRESDLRAWQRWLATLPLEVAFQPPAELRERMRRLVARQPFCFKDPRLCHTLPAWRDVLPADTRFLCVFREPAATIESILKECRDADYLRGAPIDAARAEAIWRSHYRHVLDLHRKRGEWLFVHFDQALSDAGLDRIERFVEGQVARDFPDRRLKRSEGREPVAEETAQLYRELCALAGHPASAVAIREPRRATVEVARELDRPDLSVIVCTYNRRDVLAESLASFEHQTAPAGSFELIVVDDGSTDGTARMLAERAFAAPTRVLRQPNGGLSAARNAGIKAARGELLLLVNDDTIAFPDLIAEHVHCHRVLAGEKVSVLGTFEQPERALDNALMRHLEGSLEVFCYPAMKGGELHDWNRFWTCNVSVPRDAVLRAGAFDERFRRYGCEDTDLALRLDELGYRVYFHDKARALHRHVLDLDAFARRQRTVAQAWVQLARKHPRVLDHADWGWLQDLTLVACERFVDERSPDLEKLERAARELARIDLHALDATSGVLESASKEILERLGKLIAELNAVWWRQGFAAGLVEQGLAGFAELLVDRPWPLPTSAAWRALAWPDWGNGELDLLLGEQAKTLVGRADACLVLRHDPDVDVPLKLAQRLLEGAYARQFPAGESLDVVILNETLSPSDLARLARAIDALVELPSSSRGARAEFIAALASRAS